MYFQLLSGGDGSLVFNELIAASDAMSTNSWFRRAIPQIKRSTLNPVAALKRMQGDRGGGR